jgi:hypothetical protein
VKKMECGLLEDMCRHIGQTCTIFTTSGGLSGGGFTGVLISVDRCACRLICDIGAPPACPVGSACSGGYTPLGFRDGLGDNGGCGQSYGNPLGSVTVIPMACIAAFTHHAI